MDYLRADYKRWINADSWTVERAILLLLNAETLPKQNDNYDCGSPMTIREQSVYNQFMEIWPILESSLKYGSLKKLDEGCVGIWNDVSPKDFIHWAQLKGYAIPEELIGICTATQIESVSDGGKGARNISKIFEKRLTVLKTWLKDDLEYVHFDSVIILPKVYTLESVYGELCKKEGSLFLCIELNSFDAHFWGKQKIVELMRGNKTAIS